MPSARSSGAGSACSASSQAATSLVAGPRLAICPCQWGWRDRAGRAHRAARPARARAAGSGAPSGARSAAGSVRSRAACVPVARHRSAQARALALPVSSCSSRSGWKVATTAALPSWRTLPRTGFSPAMMPAAAICPSVTMVRGCSSASSRSKYGRQAADSASVGRRSWPLSSSGRHFSRCVMYTFLPASNFMALSILSSNSPCSPPSARPSRSSPREGLLATISHSAWRSPRPITTPLRVLHKLAARTFGHGGGQGIPVHCGDLGISDLFGGLWRRRVVEPGGGAVFVTATGSGSGAGAASTTGGAISATGSGSGSGSASATGASSRFLRPQPAPRSWRKRHSGPTPISSRKTALRFIRHAA